MEGEHGGVVSAVFGVLDPPDFVLPDFVLPEPVDVEVEVDPLEPGDPGLVDEPEEPLPLEESLVPWAPDLVAEDDDPELPAPEGALVDDVDDVDDVSPASVRWIRSS